MTISDSCGCQESEPCNHDVACLKSVDCLPHSQHTLGEAYSTSKQFEESLEMSLFAHAAHAQSSSSGDIKATMKDVLLGDVVRPFNLHLSIRRFTLCN